MQRRHIIYVHSDNLLKEADKNPAVKGRASLTHELIRAYGLLPHMQLLRPLVCTAADLRGFHSHDYIQQFEQHAAASQADKDTSSEDDETASDSDFDLSLYVDEEYGLGFDCPIWPRLKEFVCHIAGATMSACDALVKSTSEKPAVIVNWTGGWHHAQRHKAAGYCYVNDIVLGILVLRKRFQRVLYVDLDVHHGDGVQGAFETTKRVFTLSFHKYECGFYPGSGSASDCGFGAARGYAANFPYKSGISGVHFKKYFNRIMPLILELYQPDACVLQCGADAVVGDPLGGTNLTPADLIDCIGAIVKRNLPTILLGGGGYHFANSSRYWTLLTATLCGGPELSDDIPDDCAQFLNYGPAYSLRIEAEKHLKDLNTEASLEDCAKTIEESHEVQSKRGLKAPKVVQPKHDNKRTNNYK